MKLFSKALGPIDDSAAQRAGLLSPPVSRRRVVLAWVAVLCWAAVIWRLGGDDYSASETSSMLVEWLRALFMDLDPSTRYRILIAVRKCAHFVEYGILALLTFRAAWISAKGHQLATPAWVTLFIVATLASADEARQAFSPVRTGSPLDVLLDLAGGAIAILGLLLAAHRARSAADDAPKHSNATPAS
jgi:VanZ family protein